ncbi:hypothetical protein C1X42_32735, partial [Pseudomonas sp. FW305-BF8]|uniref:hypothetical protein n=1 Tax=Pseudomonas sp. FW305-BF8 TaxID=2070602 RepID=UPI000CABCF8C
MLSRLWRESVQRLNARATEDENYVEILRSLAVAPGWIESQPQAALPDSAILAVGNGDTAV